MTAGDQQRAGFRDWVAVGGTVLGAFMAVLDIQVTNASLQYIQGGLAASLDQGSWISTAYLMAEIIIIPLTTWLSSIFSTRRYLLASCVAFLIFSIACGLSTSLAQMIVCRAGQGLTAGSLIPISLSTVTTRLPKSKRAMGLALFGFTATFAPAIGPTLGGWLTITYGWHYIFYVNVIPGAILIWATWYGFEREPMRLEKLWRGDWFGIATMATGLAATVAVLEEGERKDWFTTHWILYFTIIAAICLPLAIIQEITCKEPFLDLRLLRNRALGGSALIALALGLGLYGTVYVLPIYLAQIQGYDAMQIGEVVMWYGLPQLLLLPIMPIFMRHIDARALVGFGLLLFALSNYMNAYMSHDTAGEQLRLPQLVRALGQPFIIVPLTSLATGTLKRSQQQQASALFNVMRNLGGSIGIALLSTFTTIREHYHFSVIADRITNDGQLAQAHLQATAEAIAAKSGLILAHLRSIELVRDLVRREAFVMAYSDCFFIMAVGLFASIAALVFIPRPSRAETHA